MGTIPFWKERIRRAYATLRPSEQQVADYLMTNPDIASLTIKELAQRANVSEPTVIRCMRAIGFQGFKGFKQALRQKKPADEVQIPFDPLHGFSLQPWEKIADLPLKAVHVQQELLEQSLRSVVPRDLEQAVELLAKARTIDIYGVENSCAPAVDLLTKLTYLGLNSRMHTNAYLQQIAAAHLTEEDVAVAFSHSGCSADTVKALKLAHRAGAATIAISSQKDPMIRKYADIFLCAGGDACAMYGGAIFSRISDLFVVDLLYMSIMISDFERFSHNLDRSGAVVADRAYSEN